MGLKCFGSNCKRYKWGQGLATLNQLVDLVARVSGLERERVYTYGRFIRESGLIATSGRGTSAAQMTRRDAANLLIGINGSATAKGAPDRIELYRGMTDLSTGTTEFGPELESLLSLASSNGLGPYAMSLFGRGAQGFLDEAVAKQAVRTAPLSLKIEFGMPFPSASLRINQPSIPEPEPGWTKPVFSVEFMVDEHRQGPLSHDDLTDREVRITLTERTILAVGALLQNTPKAKS